MYNDLSNSSSRFRHAGAFVARKSMVCFGAVDEACAKGIHAVGIGLWWVLSKVPFIRRLVDQVHVPDADLSEQDREDRSRYRRSNGWAIFLLILLIVILPWLLGLSFGEDTYDIPKVSGEETVERVEVKKLKRRKYVFNPNAAIIWTPAPLDKWIFDDYEPPIEHRYPWPGDRNEGGGHNCMKIPKIQFTRLKHSGNGWNYRMDADVDFLNAVHKMTGVKIVPRTIVRTVSDLGRYRTGFEPPFVFMTGNGEIGLSSAEKKALREFTLETTGMLFVDNGGGNFDQSFRRLMREMYPEYPLVVISKDDPIFKSPYMFPHGAPRLFHYNNDTLGVRGPSGRWLVFYHPGGLNDVWQTGFAGLNDAWQPGSAALSRSVVKRAYQLGINVVAYSFNQKMAAKAAAGK